MNTVVYYDESHWSAVPANNGGSGPIWQWGDELLAGFTRGTFNKDGGFHQCNNDKPFESWLARSTNGGESWEAWQPDGYAGYAGKPSPTLQPAPGGIDFTGRGFVMRVEGFGYHGNAGGHWFYSQDKGATWQGPYDFGDLLSCRELSDKEFTGRTGYIINGPNDMYLFLSVRQSAENKRDDEGRFEAATGVRLEETCFLARTSDGAKTFSLVSWVVSWEDPCRAIMPAPVRLLESRIIVALRRKSATRNWIDCFNSEDDGKSWSLLSEVAPTEDANEFNGNPPALVKMSDGRLCCVFGNRSTEQIIAKYSEDGGKTWNEGHVLRDDFHSANGCPDLGYPRLWQRSDEKMVVAYFWCTQRRPQTHIAATIF